MDGEALGAQALQDAVPGDELVDVGGGDHFARPVERLGDERGLKGDGSLAVAPPQKLAVQAYALGLGRQHVHDIADRPVFRGLVVLLRILVDFAEYGVETAHHLGIARAHFARGPGVPVDWRRHEFNPGATGYLVALLTMTPDAVGTFKFKVNFCDGSAAGSGFGNFGILALNAADFDNPLPGTGDPYFFIPEPHTLNLVAMVVATLVCTGRRRVV